MAAGDVSHEVRDVLVGRRAHELLGRPELHDPSVAHDRDLVTESERLGQVVRDEHHRLAGLRLKATDLVLHVAADQRVECAERLVVEHHLRIDRERARQPDALLHAARELVGELIRAVLEADELQDLTRSRVTIMLRNALHLEPEGDIVDHRAVSEQPEVLEHHRRGVAPHLKQLAAVRGCNVASVDLDATGGRLDQPDQRPHECRFPGARQAHDDEHLTGVHLERDVADGGDATGLLAQLGARQLGVGRPDHLARVLAEDLPDPLGADERLVSVPRMTVRRGQSSLRSRRCRRRRPPVSCRARASSACRRRAPRSSRLPCTRAGRGRPP